MKTIENLRYGNDDASQALDIYLPEGQAESVFLYFHGGGLERGDKNIAAVFAPYLTDRGIAFISANYRMFPQAKYPEFILDAAQATAWAYRYMKDNLSCDKLYVGGSSAGGYLTMMLCFDRQYLTDAGLDPACIAGYFHNAGQPTAHFAVLKYGGTDPRRVIVDNTAPLYHIGIEPTYPPMRFVVSDNDMKNRYEQTMLVLSTLSHYGYEHYDHVVMHGSHCEYLRKIDESGEPVFGKMIYDFLKNF